MAAGESGFVRTRKGASVGDRFQCASLATLNRLVESAAGLDLGRFFMDINPDRHFLSSACGHNRDVSCRRAELTRKGHNFNCAAGAVGLFLWVGGPTRTEVLARGIAWPNQSTLSLTRRPDFAPWSI